MYEQATQQGLKVVLFGATNAAAQRLNAMTGVAAMLRFEMADQIEEEISGSDDGDLSSDDESEVRESDTATDKEDDSDTSKARLGDNDEEAKSGIASSQQDSELGYADMEDLDPFGQFEGVEDDDLDTDGMALFGVKTDAKLAKKAPAAKPFGGKMEDEDFM